MRQRIKIALRVLEGVRELYLKNQGESIKSLRKQAASKVRRESRVTIQTIDAHLVGKNVSSKVSMAEMEGLIGDWLIKGSDELRNLYLIDADGDDRDRVNDFFYTFASPAAETPEAIDITEPRKSARILSKTYRILRDTAMAREVKVIHQYKCQICGTTLELNNGKLYAETHHIKPLGSPHDGPDVRENVLCVCPNHHVQLDYGAIQIVKQELRILPKHDVGDEYINYHNTQIFGKY